MSDVKLRYLADTVQARKQMDKLHKENVKLKAGLKSVATGSKQFAREAKQAYMAVITPQEKYNRKVAELHRLYNRARISHGTLTRGIRRARSEMEQSGRAGEKAYGTAALGKLGAFALGFVGISKAIGLATRALSEMDQKEREIAQRQRESRAGLGILQQLPGGPGVFKERVQRSKELFLGVGGRSAGEAGREYFRIASAGQEQHAKMYSELTKKAVIEQPGIIAKNAAALKETMGGDVPTIVARGIVAGAKSPATTGEIMSATGRLGLFAREAGIGMSEVLAATAQAATGSGEAAVGGTLIKRLLAEFSEYQLLSKQEMQKKGLDPQLVAKLSQGTLASRIEALEKMGGLTLPEMQDIRGEQRAKLGYLALARKLPELRTFTQEVAAAGPAALEAKLGYSKMVPEMMAGEAAEIAGAGTGISQTRLGVHGNFADALEKDIEAAGRRAKLGRGQQWGLEAGTKALRFFMGAEKFTESFMGYGTPDTRGLYQQTREAWWDEDRAAAAKRRAPPPPPMAPTSPEALRVQEAQLQELRALRHEAQKGNQKRVPAGAGMFTEPGAG